MNIQRTPTVSVNGREYKFPKQPTVCVCIDGSEPGYIERTIEAGLAPNFARLKRDGVAIVCVAADAGCGLPATALGLSGTRTEADVSRTYFGTRGRTGRYTIIIVPPQP